MSERTIVYAYRQHPSVQSDDNNLWSVIAADGTLIYAGAAPYDSADVLHPTNPFLHDSYVEKLGDDYDVDFREVSVNDLPVSVISNHIRKQRFGGGGNG